MSGAFPGGPRRRGGDTAVIAALGIVQILTWGSSFYLLAVLAGPIATDTGWPLTLVVGGLSVGLLVAALVAPRVGTFIRSHGGRPVMMAGSALLSLGLLTLALAPALPVFLLGWCILGVGMAASLYDAAFATLGRLYGAAARRPITTLTLWGGFASTVCWPISAALVAHLGWRGACLAYAAALIAVAIPLLAWMLPAAPAAEAAPRGTAPEPTDRLDPAEQRAFRLLGAIVTLAGTLAAVISVEALVLLQARGLSLAEAVAAGALIGPAQVFSRIIEQASGGRHHPLWTLTWAIGLVALGVLLLAGGFPIAAVALIAYGAGNGLFSIAKGAVPLALFGPERYPVLMGRLARPALVAQALAPLAATLLLTLAGADVLLAVLAVLALLNAALTAMVWRARPVPAPQTC